MFFFFFFSNVFFFFSNVVFLFFQMGVLFYCSWPLLAIFPLLFRFVAERREMGHRERRLYLT